MATCLGTPSSIIVSRVPVGQKNLKRLVSAIELKPPKPRSSCKLQSKLKPQKLKNLKRLVSATETGKRQKSQSSILRFLAESGRHIKLFDLFDARFWVGHVYRFWTPKGGPPQFSTWMFVSSFLGFVVSLFW